MIKKELLEIIKCPKCKSELEINSEKKILICKSCKSEYEIDNGIPILIAKENPKN